MKTCFLPFLFLFVHCFSVEQSQIPVMERIERLEGIERNKYSTRQFNEITQALTLLDERIRIASYNVLFHYQDHRQPKGYDWATRLPSVVEIVKNFKADLIGVQEMSPGQLEELYPSISDLYAVAGEANYIFYKTARFQLLKSEFWRIGNWDLGKFNRSKESWFQTETGPVHSTNGLTPVHVRDRVSGKELAYFNTHFYINNIDVRESQVLETRDIITDFAKKNSGVAIVLGGDFNAFPNRVDISNRLPAYDGDYIVKTLKSAGLTDSYEEAVLGHIGPIATFTNEPGDPKITLFQGEGIPGILLDRLMVSKKLIPLIHVTENGKVNGKFPSDHMPILIDVVIPH